MSNELKAIGKKIHGSNKIKSDNGKDTSARNGRRNACIADSTINGDIMAEITLLSITSNAEELIEDAARTCYQSEPGKNIKVGDLIKKLIKTGHYSVLEHASAVFRLSGCSRALTHQLVRHRCCSFSQESQRYVKADQFDYVIPPEIYELNKKNNLQSETGFVSIYKDQMKQIQGMYDFWKKSGLKNEDARFVLPNACCSEIVIGANFREWRHIFETRCDKHAQLEIRFFMKEILKILSDLSPNVFDDLKAKFL